MTQLWRWIGVWVALGLVGGAVQAKPDHRTKNYWLVDAGVYGTNLRERFASSANDDGLISTLSGVARLRRGFHLGKGFFFEPSAGALVPWRSGADGSTKTFTFPIGLGFSVPVFSFLRFRGGPGVQWLLATSSGGPVTLNNGTSTSTFYTPSRVASLLLFSVDAGLEILLSKKLSLSFDSYWTAVASDRLRRLHGSVCLGWNL